MTNKNRKSKGLREILPQVKDKYATPYVLGNGRQLDLTQLLDILLNDSCEEFGSTKENKRLRLRIAVGSGRHLECSRQIGLVSDMLYVPEIVSLLTTECHKKKIDFLVNSCLDIDMLDDLQTPNNKEVITDNVLVVGSGYVNAIAASVVAYYEEMRQPLRPGFLTHTSAEIIGRSNIRYLVVTNPNCGTLILCRSPWNTQRVTIICAGILAIGTLGTNALLYHYLKGSGADYGNNKYDPKVPSKVVDVHFKTYGIELYPMDQLYPVHDVRNIKEGHGLTDGVTILE